LSTFIIDCHLHTRIRISLSAERNITGKQTRHSLRMIQGFVLLFIIISIWEELSTSLEALSSQLRARGREMWLPLPIWLSTHDPMRQNWRCASVINTYMLTSLEA